VRRLLAGAALLALGAGPARATESADESATPGRTGKGSVAIVEEQPEAAPVAQAELRLVSNYFWRGYALSQDAPAAQPWAQLTWQGLGGWVWSSSALDRRLELDELAAGLSYQRTFAERWTVIGGYSFYLSPGTETEPSANPDDPLAPSSSGELMLAVAATLGPGSLQLTYSRGHGDGEGNSLNLWGQLAIATPWEALGLAPYVQADYMDQYQPPPGLIERLTNVEGGLAVRWGRGRLALWLVGALVYIPSPYIRASNLAAGSSDARLRAFAALALAYSGAGW
jgi:hypothetical protein